MRRTIHCELKGNPVTAAGPNERAVFMPAPVYGTANLQFHGEGRGASDGVVRCQGPRTRRGPQFQK
jgi:hypothetical protein